MDGIDAVLTKISPQGHCKIVATHSAAYSSDLKTRTAALASGQTYSLSDLGEADRLIGRAFADTTLELIDKTGYDAADIAAIGSHGQTVHHSPNADEDLRFSLQIGDAATIAELTRIHTIADFRRQDIAAGGQGAPLVPRFHGSHFGQDGEARVIVNIGGISNATVLRGENVIGGFDCGPGNTLLDAWVRKHQGLEFDADGAWSAENTADSALLATLLSDPYFEKRGPRSTGPEYFNLGWLTPKLAPGARPGDVQATLAELTAATIANSILDAEVETQAVFVCGGGARNIDLMRRLNSRLVRHDIRLGTTDELGIAADWVEACAFAWLAYRHLEGLPGNAPCVTGASGERVLGASYQPPN